MRSAPESSQALLQIAGSHAEWIEVLHDFEDFFGILQLHARLHGQDRRDLLADSHRP